MMTHVYQLDDISVVDVTDTEDLLIAHKLVGNAYAELSSQALNPTAVENELTADRFFERRVTRTLLACVDGRTERPLGTMRVVLGNAGDDPFEFLDLMSPTDGWENFTEHFSVDRDFEISRIAFAQAALTTSARACQRHLKTLRALTFAAGRVGQLRFRRTRAWMIASQRVANAFRRSGLLPAPIAGPTPNWQRHKSLFNQFDKYWVTGGPTFYRLRGWESAPRPRYPSPASHHDAYYEEHVRA
ncbi:MAG: hypothetical protein K0U93_29115 [Gammaproteobacteria bacterium]|nr:hypothetical protein [Gammaproteobacteria bacterium]